MTTKKAVSINGEGRTMDGALANGEAAELQDRLCYFAWRWYRLPRQVAEDLVQAALLTFLQVKDRYPRPEEHRRILVGIFRNKCREHIDEHVRTARRIRTLVDKAASGTATIRTAPCETTQGDGVVDEIVQREAFHVILQALAELRPDAREMFRLIVDEGASRQDLIRRYGLNKNTLDSRLHTYRKELRMLLSRRGIDA